MICALILAAGESKRMGKPKMLLPFGGKSIIETVIDNVGESEAEKILVILGATREKIETRIKKLPVDRIFNPNFRIGMLSSIQAGFQALTDETTAALVLLGDQPLVSSSIINQVIAAHRQTNQGILVPVYKERRGHPVLIDMKFREEVKALNPEIGLRELLHRHPQDVLHVTVDESLILQDIDDVQDYESALKKL